MLLSSALAAAVIGVLTSISATTVQVKVQSSGELPGLSREKSKVLAYADSPVLTLRGTWRELADEPPSRPPFPRLAIPTRIVVPGVFRLIDPQSVTSVSGEVMTETHVQNAKIFRVELELDASRTLHRFQITDSSHVRVADLAVETRFSLEKAIVMRSKACRKLGVDVEAAQPGSGVIMLHCRPIQAGGAEAWLYAFAGKAWSELPATARRVYGERGVILALQPKQLQLVKLAGKELAVAFAQKP